MTCRPQRPRGSVGLAVLVLAAACADGSTYDIVLRGGQVVDGTGAPARQADVAIRDGRIAAVGDLSGAVAEQNLDATGLYVAPGFIDSHSHAGPGLATEALSHGEPLLAQGITTVLINPDGGGAVDLAEQRLELEAHGLGVNAAQLTAHGSVRRQVLGMDDRAPSAAELDEMRRLVREGMEAGAWGMSSGTFYAPGAYSEKRGAGGAGAGCGGVRRHLHQPHPRRVQLHDRPRRRSGGGDRGGTRRRVDRRRDPRQGAGSAGLGRVGRGWWSGSKPLGAQGVSIYADQYPYLASATGLSAALLPRWSQAGGGEAFEERLADPATRSRIRDAMVENLARRGGADRIQFRRFREDPSIEGRLLSEGGSGAGAPTPWTRRWS